MIKILKTALSIALLSLLVLTNIASAAECDGYYGDNTSGFSFLSSHAGTINYKYSISDLDENGDPNVPLYAIGLADSISTAKSNWGVINLNKSNGTSGTIYNSRINEEGVYARGGPSGGPPHATSWSVYTRDLFYSQSDNLKSIIIEHEIGHAYGLDHVDYQYWDCVMSLESHPAANDIWGMKFCTHLINSHTHSAWTYTSYTTGQHKKRCGVCLGYSLQNHVWGSWSDYNSTQHVRYCSLCNVAAYQNHTWPSNWTDYSSTQHRNACTACGRYKYESHIYPSTWILYSSTQHRRQCTATDCGHYQYASHTYPSTWLNYSSTQHRRACTACGYYVYANHNYPSTATNYSSSQHYYACIQCGRRKYESHQYIPYDDGYICTKCGRYYIPAKSGIME